MTLHGTSFRLCGALVAAALVWSAPAAAQSQTIANPDNKKAAAKPAPKPAPKPKLSDQPGDNYWTAKTDLGGYSRETPSERTALDRQQLRDAPGSVGFHSGAIRSGTLADGRAAAGMERYNQTSESYAGMSLSITSSNKSFPLLSPGIGGSGW